MSIFTTLISELEDDNFDSLIEHERLLQEGYAFHYILDADLIGNYCFPYSLQEGEIRRKGRNITTEYISDEQVTLHLLFHFPINVKHEFLFEGYVQELGGMINKVRKAALEDPSFKTIIGNQLDNLLPKIKLSHEEAEAERMAGNTNVAEEYFSKIISTVLLRIDGLKKIRMLLENEFFTYETMDLEDELLENACDFEKGDEQRENIIKSIYSHVFRRSTSKVSDRDKSVDANIIERTLSINNFIQKNGQGKSKKNVFLLAVDAPLTQKVFDFIKSSQILEYPNIDGRKVNLYRTTQEYFAYITCCVYNEDRTVNHQQTIENLKNLRTANKLVKKGANSLIALDAQSVIYDNYNNLLTTFGNLGILRNFDAIYNSIKGDLGDGRIIKIKQFLDEIKREETNLLQHVIRTHEQMLDNVVHEAKFNEIFLNGMSIMNRDGFDFDISKGADSVEGSYQHLPVFFKFSKIPGSGTYNDDLLKITLPILQRKVAGNDLLMDDIRKLLNRLHHIKSRSKYPLEEKLIKTLLFLILPISFNGQQLSPEEKLANDMAAYHWLKKIADYKEDMGLLLSEFRYIRCWVARRVNYFDEARGIALEGIRDFPEDPRFYHGLLLADYCLYLDMKETFRTVGMVNEMIGNGLKAHRRYPAFIGEFYDNQYQNELNNRIGDCFNNNFCFLYTEKAYLLYREIKPAHALEALQTARQYLAALQMEEGNNEVLPEYFDTAAYFFYQESFHPELDPVQKIQDALDAIDKALLKTTQRGLRDAYDKRRKLITEREAVIRETYQRK